MPIPMKHCIFLLSLVLHCSLLSAQKFKLIAHRGGIIEGRYVENSKDAIEAAILRGYWMLEVDVRETKDGRLVVHHDENFQRFYGDPRKVAEVNMDEIKQLKSKPGGERPLEFTELAALCKGRIRLMVDTKGPSHPERFYQQMEKALMENDLMRTAYFIGTQEARDYFKGKAKISINKQEFQALTAPGEDVSQKYFLFAHGNELDSVAIAQAQEKGITIVPSINLFHYTQEDPMEGAYRHIQFLIGAGVTEFQIDSEYDAWLNYQIYRTDGLMLGPWAGHVGQQTARIWARASRPGNYFLHLAGEDRVFSAESKLDNDFCLIWELSGLMPGKKYSYYISNKPYKSISIPQSTFVTPALDSTPREVKLAFGSCADDDKGVAYPVWKSIQQEQPEAMVLLGDTPYIDATNKDHQNRRYREFASVPEFGNLLHTLSLYSVWDDHDFGKNDTDGKVEDKENARNAFMRYRANPSYGHNDAGIYTRFRRGPVEVFLLDTRWFAGTETSYADSKKPTLLGKTQWEWLKKELAESKAEFKLLACGMIWNGSTRPNKPDHWGAYPHEYQALMEYIGKKGITGVILVGGDIHRSRYLLRQSKALAGYNIPELITSPLHNSVIEAANAAHPDLVFDMGKGEAYMMIRADNSIQPAKLTATFMADKGKPQYKVEFTTEDLKRK